ncbi:hypothetical protein LEP1GSC043_0634 [Leptospira weilii str. Ecochallenge]|uniref:Uncharacterized protein n=2 Tax=Leptospira weilii TaxID=28184 RepID=N1U599_9LEPT|nr:hypothetical protein LEP1GSC038_4028 [Leptospira weilii str. 2006001855]EMY13311.1 hypothetical protein LEP1GSC043_0634 [Leptospira weilii str. Ecochallenge]
MGFVTHKQFVLVLLFCFLVTFDCIASKKKKIRSINSFSVGF